MAGGAVAIAVVAKHRTPKRGHLAGEFVASKGAVGGEPDGAS